MPGPKNPYVIDGRTAVVEIRQRTGEVRTALIDAEDLSRLDGYRLSMASQGYVKAYKKGRCCRLHRLLIAAPPHKEVDHKNRVRTDCTKANLEIVSASQNALNKGGRNVHFDRRTNKYRAVFFIRHKCNVFGYFESEEDALALAADVRTKLRAGEKVHPRTRQPGKSGKLGVRFDRGKWIAQAFKNYKPIYIGRYPTKSKAVVARAEFLRLLTDGLTPAQAKRKLIDTR